MKPSNVNRAARRRIARMGADIYVQELAIEQTHLSRRERREKMRQLTKRVLNETPAAQFERHMAPQEALIEKPRVIIPEVDIQAEGVDIPRPAENAIEKRSPGGIILI